MSLVKPHGADETSYLCRVLTVFCWRVASYTFWVKSLEMRSCGGNYVFDTFIRITPACKEPLSSHVRVPPLPYSEYFSQLLCAFSVCQLYRWICGNIFLELRKKYRSNFLNGDASNFRNCLLSSFMEHSSYLLRVSMYVIYSLISSLEWTTSRREGKHLLFYDVHNVDYKRCIFLQCF